MGNVPSDSNVWRCGRVVVREPTPVCFARGQRDWGVARIYAIVHYSKVHYQWLIVRTPRILVHFGVRVGQSPSDDAIDIDRRGLLAYATHRGSLDSACVDTTGGRSRHWGRLCGGKVTMSRSSLVLEHMHNNCEHE